MQSISDTTKPSPARASTSPCFSRASLSTKTPRRRVQAVGGREEVVPSQSQTIRSYLLLRRDRGWTERASAEARQRNSGDVRILGMQALRAQGGRCLLGELEFEAGSTYYDLHTGSVIGKPESEKGCFQFF